MTDHKKLLFLIAFVISLVACDSDRKPVGMIEASTLSYAQWGWGDSQQCCPRLILICKKDGREAARLEKSFEWQMNAGQVYRWYPNLNDAKLAAEKITDERKLCDD